MQDPFDALYDFVVSQQFATAGGGATFFNSGHEVFVIIEKAIDSFFDHLLGILPDARRELFQLRLLVRAKSHFHAVSVSGAPRKRVLFFNFPEAFCPRGYHRSTCATPPRSATFNGK